jgi:hypothetical protein
MRPRRRLTARVIPPAWGALAALSSLAACSGAPGGDGGAAAASQPVLGGTATTGCTRAQRTVLRHALLLGRARVLSEGYAACLERTVTSRPYVPCVASLGQTRRHPVDPPLAADKAAAALAVGIAREENGTHIRCEDLQRNANVSANTRGLTLWQDIHGVSYDGLEQLSLDSDGFLDPAAGLAPGDLARVANTIWHEVFHTHGFWHDAPNTQCLDQELAESMPVIAGECVESGIALCGDPSPCTEGGTIGFASGNGCECLSVLGGPKAACRHTNSFPDCDESSTFVGPAAPIVDLNEDGDAFGTALAAGDFDGDGFDDLAVGVPGEDGGQGAVDVYFGTKFGLVPLVRLRGSADAELGRALATGDFNRDGLADLAAGGPGFLRSLGSVWVMHGTDRDWARTGGLNFWPEARQYLFGRELGDRFGESLVATAGTAGLALPILAVGLPGRHQESGAVHLFFPNANGDALDFARELAPAELATGSRFGAAVASGIAGNAHEPFDALLVGAPLADAGRGRAYLVAGARLVFEPWLGAEPQAMTRSELSTTMTDGAGFGQSVAFWSRQGYHQPLVGAPGAGSVQMFDTEMTDPAAAKLARALSGRRGFGAALLGAERELAPGNMASYLFVGIPSELAGVVEVFVQDPERIEPVWTQRLDQLGLSDERPGDQFGAALALGDFDGDGILDLAVGAPGERARGECGPPSGAVFIFRNDPLCKQWIPAKVLTQEGGIEEFERPLVPWHSGASYQAGDRVRFECRFFEAEVGHDGSFNTVPGRLGSPWVEIR